ncbi:DNA-binding SARP family transcriptional activator [Clostridiales Family XIII bacterium PM5-7]
MEVRIYLLQRPRIEIEGQEVLTKLNNKALALVLYLASKQGESISKEVISEIFWPEQQEENARSNLRQTLSYIKKVCNEEWGSVIGEDVSIITSERNLCAMNENLNITVDIIDYQNLIQEAKETDEPMKKINYLQQAADIYQGNILTGIYVRGSAAFEEWLMYERESVNQNLVQICKNLSELYRKANQLEKAIDCLKKLLAVDPLLEDVHLALMQLYYDNKERTKAIYQYKECVKILGEELNIGPMEETRNLYKQISEASTSSLEASPSKRQTAVDCVFLIQGKRENAIRYECIYNSLEPTVEHQDAVPEYLKRGLAIIFPQYASHLDGQNLNESYLFFTIKKLFEELSDQQRVCIKVKQFSLLDEGTKEIVNYLLDNLDHPNIDIKMIKEE